MSQKQTLRRRRVLGFGVAALSAFSGCSGTSGSGGGDKSGKEFGIMSPGFKSIQWVNLDVLQITFSEDHSIDYFTVNHEHQPDYEDAIHDAAAPDFSGPVKYQMIEDISNSDVVYPSRTFKLHAYAGDYNGGTIPVIDEKMGSVSFTVPEQIAPPEKFEDL